MKKIIGMERVGILLLAIGAIFFALEVLELQPFAFISKYGNMLFTIGAAFWALGYFNRRKASKTDNS